MSKKEKEHDLGVATEPAKNPLDNFMPIGFEKRSKEHAPKIHQNSIDFGECSFDNYLGKLKKVMPTIKENTYLTAVGFTAPFDYGKFPNLTDFLKYFTKSAYQRELMGRELMYLYEPKIQATIKDTSTRSVEHASKIKDSGARTEFSTGAVRDMQSGKGRRDLLPMRAMIELSKHFEEGSKKYGDRNWEKGIELHAFVSSSMNHLFKFMIGETDEPHLTAAAWNIMCLLDTIIRIKEGKLPSSINTLPFDIETINLHWREND